MSAHLAPTNSKADKLASEAARYLDAVEVFASLGADPHAAVRARAARARRTENQSAQTRREEVRRWAR